MDAIAFYEYDFDDFSKIFQKKWGVKDDATHTNPNNSNPFLTLEYPRNRHHYFINNNKIAIICEPYKQMFEAVDTCIKAKMASDNNPNNIDYMLIIVDGNMFRVKERPKKSIEFIENNLEEIDHEILLVNYTSFTKPGVIGDRQMFIEFVKEEKLEDAIFQIYNESEDMLNNVYYP